MCAWVETQVYGPEEQKLYPLAFSMVARYWVRSRPARSILIMAWVKAATAYPAHTQRAYGGHVGNTARSREKYSEHMGATWAIQ